MWSTSQERMDQPAAARLQAHVRPWYGICSKTRHESWTLRDFTAIVLLVADGEKDACRMARWLLFTP